MQQQSTKPAQHSVLRVIVPLLTVVSAVAAGAVLLRTPPQVPKSRPETVRAVVGTVEVSPRRETIQVHALGTVMPAREMQVRPQVGGRVVAMHDRLMPGGLIREGETLFEVERTDYEIAVQQAEADVEIAALRVTQLESSVDALRSQAKRIEAELDYLRWNASRLLGLFEQNLAGETEVREAESTRLSQEAAWTALQAQLHEREAAIASAAAEGKMAQSRLDAAKLALSRTTVAAPFDALVRSESVEIGQLIGPNNAVATLAATDEAWVEASVPASLLHRIRFADRDPASASMVEIRLAQVEQATARKGVALRSLGALDPQGRMARVLVGISDPLNLPADGAPTDPADRQSEQALLFGSYVRLQFDAGMVDDVYPIPRSALRENDRVWVRDADGLLQIRTPQVVWRRQDDVLVRGGFESGDELVTTHLASVVPGMPLDVRELQGAAGIPNQQAPINTTPPATPTTEP